MSLRIGRALAVGVFVLASSGRAAVVLDAASSAQVGNDNRLSWNHTVKGSRRMLVVGVGSNASVPVESITIDGVPLTRMRVDTSVWTRTELWSLRDPPTGTLPIVVTMSGVSGFNAGASSWTGVATADELPEGSHGGTFGMSNRLLFGLGAAPGDVIVDIASQGRATALTPLSHQTMDWAQAGPQIFTASSSQSGALPARMGWQSNISDAWTVSAIVLRPAPTRTVRTTLPTALTKAAVKLNGFARPAGIPTTAWFRYSATDPGTCNDAFGTRVPTTGGIALGASPADIAFSQDVTGITPGTLYYACALTKDASGIAVGEVQRFVAGSPIRMDAVSSASAFGTSVSWSHAVNGVRRILVVGVATGGSIPVASVKYGDVPLTKIRHDQSAEDIRTELWYLLAPRMGTANVVVRLSTDQNIVAGAASFVGVGTSAALAIGANAGFDGVGGQAGTTVVGEAGGWVVDVTASAEGHSTIGPGTGQTVLWSHAGEASNAQTSAGAASSATVVSHAVTAYPWAISAVALKAGSSLNLKTRVPTDVGATRAILGGVAIPGATTATGYFRYGLTHPIDCNDSFGARVPSLGVPIGAGTTETGFSLEVEGLMPDTTYYVCAMALTAETLDAGNVVSFHTRAPAFLTLSVPDQAAACTPLVMSLQRREGGDGTPVPGAQRVTVCASLDTVVPSETTLADANRIGACLTGWLAEDGTATITWTSPPGSAAFTVADPLLPGQESTTVQWSGDAAQTSCDLVSEIPPDPTDLATDSPDPLRPDSTSPFGWGCAAATSAPSAWAFLAGGGILFLLRRRCSPALRRSKY